MARIRVTGRTLRPGDLSTRRFFLGTLGVEFIKVPRSENPYAVARRIRRSLQHDDVTVFKKLAATARRASVPIAPDVDSSDAACVEDHAAAAE